MEQSSILSAKFDCPVARQNISFLATAHDCETGLFKIAATTRAEPLKGSSARMVDCGQ